MPKQKFLLIFVFSPDSFLQRQQHQSIIISGRLRETPNSTSETTSPPTPKQTNERAPHGRRVDQKDAPTRSRLQTNPQKISLNGSFEPELQERGDLQNDTDLSETDSDAFKGQERDQADRQQESRDFSGEEE